MDLESLQYPIGRFQWNGESDSGDREGWLQAIADTPDQLRLAVSGLTQEQLDTPYRPGPSGRWSITTRTIT